MKSRRCGPAFMHCRPLKMRRWTKGCGKPTADSLPMMRESARYGNARGYDRPLHAARRKRPRRNSRLPHCSIRPKARAELPQVSKKQFASSRTTVRRSEDRSAVAVGKDCPAISLQDFLQIQEDAIESSISGTRRDAVDRLAEDSPAGCARHCGLAGDHTNKSRAQMARGSSSRAALALTPPPSPAARRDSEVEAVKVHHLGPRLREVLRKLLLRVRARIDFRERPAAASASRR